MATPGTLDNVSRILEDIQDTGEKLRSETSFFDVARYIMDTLGFLINGFTLVVVLVKQNLRRQHNVFTFNLALADFMSTTSYLSDAFSTPRNHQMIKDTFVFSCMISSNINILSVAVHRLITIRIDPFRSRGIVTTTRCLIACAISWCVSFAAGAVFSRHRDFLVHGIYGSVFLASLVMTGLCYLLIYRAVTSNSCKEALTRQRLEENWRLLQAFSLIYGLTVFCWIWLCAIWLSFYNHHRVPLWLNYMVHACFSLSRIINPAIYWWRLNEFRALLPTSKCCKRNEVQPLQSDGPI
ncbi:rhodopsin-like [Lytechinus variegatus]|uniref:rhodopsin-like n=1 Tax=Lytechinus variegatus TaxID=7654 RepID=UPI001BB29BA1|nr:rhodopsin-like [Lytechinus variegatus]